MDSIIKQKSKDTSSLAVDFTISKAKDQVAQTSRCLEQAGVHPRTSAAEHIEAQLKTGFGGEFSSQVRDRMPPGYGQVEDQNVKDRAGNSLMMRTENGNPDRLSRSANQDTAHPFHQICIRLFENNQFTGCYANLQYEICKEFNEQTGHYDQILDLRMRLNDIYVPEEQRRQGRAALMLKQAETISIMSSSRELYGNIDPCIRFFYENSGFDTRTVEDISDMSAIEQAYKNLHF